MTTTTVSSRLASESEPLLLVGTTVNGRGPYDFILDTGAAARVVSPELAAELGLVHGVEQPGMGAGGALVGMATHLDEVAVGEARVIDVSAAILDLRQIAGALGVGVRGIVGHPFLSRHVVTIDYPRRELRLEAPIPARPAAPAGR